MASFLEKPRCEEIAPEFAAASPTALDGRQIGNYQFVSLLGTGGMGEVYRAHDTKLKRDVAIKVFPDAASLDVGTRRPVSARSRSAGLAESSPYWGDLRSGRGRGIVVPRTGTRGGRDVGRAIERGPIPLDEGLQIAAQILDGLAAAHERGIIHRDLKPANIKRTPEGKVKVLDFGLAKAFAVESVDPPPANPPRVMPSSTPGMILGTMAYMSPEQASGTAVDRRTDIFAFGAVLYEMLSGQPAFPGETASAILAAVIRAEPDWRKLPASTPAGIRRLLRRCLQKDRNRRLQTAGDARIEIDEAANEPQQDADVLPARIPGTACLDNVRAGWTDRCFGSSLDEECARQSPDASLATEARLELNTPPTTEPVSLAISPDGQKIVYVAGSEGQSLWVRPLDSVLAQPLAGTDGATYPFWSPDSRSIGFFAQGKLKRINTVSGFVETLAAAVAGRGGAWGPDGTIIFSASPSSPILRLPSGGGEPVAITQLELLRHGSHRYPQFFPGWKTLPLLRPRQLGRHLHR